MSPGLPDEAIDLRKAESGARAGRLGGEERLENPSEHLGSHALAGVGDGDHDIFADAGVGVGFDIGFVETGRWPFRS